jgi:hypothetical protein
VPLLPLLVEANAGTTGNESVMTAYWCGGFYVDGPSLCAETLDSTLGMSDWDKFNRMIAEQHVAYVVAPTELGNGTRPPDVGARSVTFLARADEYAVISRLLRERGELLATQLDQSLYRIRPAGSTPSG